MEDRDNPDVIRVRCRVKADAEYLTKRLQELGGGKRLRITEDEYADYLYRVLVPRAAFAAFAMDQALNIDYANFKSEVTKRQGHKRHSVYIGVWSELLRLQPYKKWKRADDKDWDAYFDERYGPLPEELPGLDVDLRDSMDEEFRRRVFDPELEEQVRRGKRGSRRSKARRRAPRGKART